MFHERSYSSLKGFCHFSFSESQHHTLQVTIFFEMFPEIWNKKETQVSSYPELRYVISLSSFID